MTISLFDVLSSLLDDQISQERCDDVREHEVGGPIQRVRPIDRHLFPPEGAKISSRLLFRDPGDETPWNVAVLWLQHNYEPKWLSEPDVDDQPVSGRRAVGPFAKTEAPDEVPDSRLREYMMHRRAFKRGLSMPAKKGITRDLTRFEKHGAVQKLIEHVTKYFPDNSTVTSLRAKVAAISSNADETSAATAFTLDELAILSGIKKTTLEKRPAKPAPVAKSGGRRPAYYSYEAAKNWLKRSPIPLPETAVEARQILSQRKLK